jgi:hypothetical protein
MGESALAPGRQEGFFAHEDAARLVTRRVGKGFFLTMRILVYHILERKSKISGIKQPEMQKKKLKSGQECGKRVENRADFLYNRDQTMIAARELGHSKASARKELCKRNVRPLKQ